MNAQELSTKLTSLELACKYGYEYHKNSQFTDLSFEDNCLNNFRQKQQSVSEQELSEDKNDFLEYTKRLNIENPGFDKSVRATDWQSYVPYDWQKNWSEFTVRERRIIAVMAEMQADSEDLS